MQCKLFNPNGCWDGFIFNYNGHCNYPFVLKPKKDTCDYFRVAAQNTEESGGTSANTASAQAQSGQRA
jgi:hypothetical protein